MSAQDLEYSGTKRHPVVEAYEGLVRWAGPVVLSLFLLLIRIVWGWQFFMAGRPKLAHPDKIVPFFQKLGIPAPTLNVWIVAIVETFGGLLLLAGAGARAVCIALIINMSVAYLTADREALMALFKEGDVAKFAAATPCWFLVTSVLVLALGPGMFSIDALLKRFVFHKDDLRRGFPTRSKL